MGTRAVWHNKIHSPSGASRSRDSVFYVSYCPHAHVLTGTESVASALYIIKLQYNSTVSMVTDAVV